MRYVHTTQVRQILVIFCYLVLDFFSASVQLKSIVLQLSGCEWKRRFKIGHAESDHGKYSKYRTKICATFLYVRIHLFMISFCVSDPKSSLLSWATQFKCNRSMPNAEDGTSIELCNGWPHEISNRSTKKTNNHRLWISNMTNGNDHHSENSKNGCCLRVTWLWWYMQSNLVAPRTWMGGGESETERVCWRALAPSKHSQIYYSNINKRLFPSR